MKKCLLALGALALSAVGFSQSAYDAINLNQMDPMLGTARYSAMAGAFGAFGGNPSAAKDNPAGLGVYKCIDLSFTPNLYLDNDKEVGFCLNNFAVVINFRNHENREKGYITSSLGISYNRLRNFSRYSSVNSLNFSGKSLSDDMATTAVSDNVFNNALDLGLVAYDENGDAESRFSLSDNFDKSTRFIESGHAGQWDFSYGMNISNRVYLGAAMGVANLTYSQKALYDETSLNANGDYFYFDNYYRAEGVGVNFKVGAIVKATDFLRLGFTVHTPTFYNIDEEYSKEFDYNDQYPEQPEIEYGNYNYDMTSPFQLQASLGFVIANRALIGLEYDYDNYSTMRLKSKGVKLENECAIIKENFKASHTMKLGAEFKVIDQFALRAGFAYVTPPMEYTNDIARLNMISPYSVPQHTHYITAGAGYEGAHFYCDLAYVFRNQNTRLFQMLPQDESACDLNLKNHNISATFGWRF